MNLDFKNMTDEQKAALKKQILEEEAQEKAERKDASSRLGSANYG